MLWRDFFTAMDERYGASREALAAYPRRIIENVLASSDGALTGPVARGDTDVKRQTVMTTKGTGPMEVVVYVPTQGASIGYTTEDGPAAKWQLYTGPILVNGPMTIRAKAIRYGYKESAESRITIGAESTK